MRKVITLKLTKGSNPYDGSKGYPLKVLTFKAAGASWQARVLVDTGNTIEPCTFTVAPDGTAVAETAGACVGWTDTAALFSSCFAGV